MGLKYPKDTLRPIWGPGSLCSKHCVPSYEGQPVWALVILKAPTIKLGLQQIRPQIRLFASSGRHNKTDLAQVGGHF
jgi:hypothetical protein